MEQKCDQWFGYYDRVAFLVFCFIFVVIHGVLFFWLINNPYKKRRQLNRKEQDYAKKKIGQRSVRLKSMLYGIWERRQPSHHIYCWHVSLLNT